MVWKLLRDKEGQRRGEAALIQENRGQNLVTRLPKSRNVDRKALIK
jgi:hypothetical protein